MAAGALCDYSGEPFLSNERVSFPEFRIYSGFSCRVSVGFVSVCVGFTSGLSGFHHRSQTNANPTQIDEHLT